MKRKVLAALLVMGLCVGTASAQFGFGIVYDPTNYANAVLRYGQLVQQLNQLRQTYTQIVQQYNLAVQMAKSIQNMPARYEAQFSQWRNVVAPDAYGNTAVSSSALRDDLSTRRRTTFSSRWTMLPGAAIFYGSEFNPGRIFWMWVGFAILMGAPWALLCSPSPRRLGWAIPTCFVLTSIPPVAARRGQTARSWSDRSGAATYGSVQAQSLSAPT